MRRKRCKKLILAYSFVLCNVGLTSTLHNSCNSQASLDCIPKAGFEVNPDIGSRYLGRHASMHWECGLAVNEVIMWSMGKK